MASAGSGSFHHLHLSLSGQTVSNCTWLQEFQLRAYASALRNPKGGENQSRAEEQENSPSPSNYPHIHCLMKRVWFPSETNPSYDNLMLWSASTIAFLGFCHSGEITTPSDNSCDPNIHLSYADIATYNPKCPSIATCCPLT